MLAICVLAAGTGCQAIDFYTPSLQMPVPAELEAPRELSMMSLPAYRIEPPDEITIRVSKLIPRPSYRIAPSDVLEIEVLGTLRDRRINRLYIVEADGTVNLGLPYGTVSVSGLTVEGAIAEITRVLQGLLKTPMVSVKLSRSADRERIADRHRTVEPDGMVSLGRYGMVYVSGKTVTEASEAVRQHLLQYFDSPQVSVEVEVFGSKCYYVVTEELGGRGNMLRFPITGNETVLDAVCQMCQAYEPAGMSSKTLWVARPTPGSVESEQILPVDWDAVAHGGRTDTNYQLLPGDRVYVVDDSLDATSRVIVKFTNPIRQLLGIAQLGATTGTNMQALGREYNKRRVGRRGF